MRIRSFSAAIAALGAVLWLTGCAQPNDTAAAPETSHEIPNAAEVAIPADALEQTAEAPTVELDPAALPASGKGLAPSVPLVHRRTIELADMDTPKAQLGARLFRENRISNPGSQYVASCRSCHQPQDSPEGARVYADRRALSLVPAVSDDMKKTTARNTPTLLDAALATHFNHDGRYTSLEETIREKMLGREFGWLPEQRGQARDELHALIVNDTGAGTSNDGLPYLAEFKAAYEADLANASGDVIVDAIATALADYVRLLKTPETSPYDAMAYLDRFGTQVEQGEQPIDYSGRLFGRIANIEGRVQVKFPHGIGELEYQGFKIFMRMYQEGPEPGHIGNCVACHYPPKFSDFKFHNTGVAQMEYDAVHGEGAFAKREIPGLDAARPIGEFGTPPTAGDPAAVDLGHWNYIDIANSPQREAGKSDGAFLASMVGAFKTPPLRNLDLSDPYMHNGRYKTIEDAVRQKIKASQMAKDGTLINPDPALLNMDITEDDVAPLAAFLRALHEVDTAHFRDVVVEDTRIRPAE